MNNRLKKSENLHRRLQFYLYITSDTFEIAKNSALNSVLIICFIKNLNFEMR